MAVGEFLVLTFSTVCLSVCVMKWGSQQRGEEGRGVNY